MARRAPPHPLPASWEPFPLRVKLVAPAGTPHTPCPPRKESSLRNAKPCGGEGGASGRPLLLETTPSCSGGGALNLCLRGVRRGSRLGSVLLLLTGLCLVLLALSAPPSKAQSSGHWELIKTESTGQNIPTPAARYQNRDFYEGKSANGRVEGHATSYYDQSRDTLTTDLAGYISWTPPPGRAAPGDSWDGAYAGAVTKDYSMYRASGLNQTWTLSVDTGHRFVDTPSGVGIGYWNQPVGFFKTSDPRATVPAKTSVFTFPDPKGSSAGNGFLVVQVNLQLSMGGSDNYNYY